MAFMSSGFSAIHERFADLDDDSRRRVVKFAACVGGVVAVRQVGLHLYRYFDQRRARQKKLDQLRTTKGKLLQKLVGLGTPIENKDVLTRLSYEEMRAKLEKGELQALNLLEAFQAKSLQENPRLNSVNEVVYEADVTALYLDSLSKEERGLLHGIPLSVSDAIDFKGHDTYLGCASQCFKPVQRSDPVVKALENAGMIPFARTNTPQLGLGMACTNPVFGRTVHPSDPKRSPGACGGEAALIAAGGSVAGLGVDRGGSLRLSAAFCGLFGFRPTAARIGDCRLRNAAGRTLPLQGPFSSSCAGPLARDLDLLVAMMRTLFSPALFDVSARVPHLSFRSKRFDSEKPLRIGLLTLPGQPPLTPAVKQALEEVKAALESGGHTVVSWEAPDAAVVLGLLLRSLFIDGGAVYARTSAQEVFLSGDLRRLRRLGYLPSHLKLVIAFGLWILSPLVSHRLCISRGERNPAGVLDLSAAIEDYRERFASAWEDAELDAVVCPVTNIAAPLNNDAVPSVDTSYTALFSLLDYPAGVVPVGKVTENDCVKLAQSYPRRDLMSRWVVRSQSGATGLPTAVQCVAPRFQDEVALRLMREVRDGLAD